ncbi:hypothetical protein N2152v2_002079 [Parachlorella kessleri]
MQYLVCAGDDVAVLVVYSLFSSAVLLRTVVPSLDLKHGLDWAAASLERQASTGIPRRQLYEQHREAAMEISDATSSSRQSSPPEPIRTLSFTVCNGFANQRLALLNGVIVGKELNRAVVLPQLIAAGRQEDPSVTVYEGIAGVPMSMFYNTTLFGAALERLGVRVVSKAAEGSSRVVPENETEAALQQSFAEDHLQFGCPLLRLGPEVMLRNEQLVFASLSAMLPNDTLGRLVSRGVHSLRALSPTGVYNMLHLRLESDWLTHCSSWRFGSTADNCFTNTLSVDEHISIKNISPDVPLYVTYDREAVSKPILAHVLGRIQSAGYHIVERTDILPTVQLPRELAALLEYYIALSAHKYIGNSVSTFSALAILEREHQGTWASYYNMGDIPLAAFLPLYRMPWVFTYNGASPRVNYMIKAAVVSAREARLTPFCVYNGTTQDPMYVWLQENGVRVVMHVPQWLPDMQRVFPVAKSNVGWSPLYKSFESLFGTFQRIDVPIVAELEEFNYVLFTDADVVFERKITLQDFAQPLPVSLAMAYEMDNIFPCNAGVALLNLPYLRATYEEFVGFVFSNPTLYYEGYGPGDQGALNQFYAESMGRKCSLSEAFNAKPHKNGNLDKPYIVHFHGPKPMDYLRWEHDGSCDFGLLCAKGYDMACSAMQRHQPYLLKCWGHAAAS